MFENHPIVPFQHWHFPPFFVLLKLTCLVTLLDRNHQFFKEAPKWTIFGTFNELLSTENVNVTRFARNVEWDFLWDFQTPYFAYRSLSDKKAKRCNICGKIYVSMPAYAMHLRTHNQNCKCSICGKTFSRPWLLQGHLRTHTGKLFWPFFYISHCLKVTQNVSFDLSNFCISPIFLTW